MNNYLKSVLKDAILHLRFQAGIWRKLDERQRAERWVYMPNPKQGEQGGSFTTKTDDPNPESTLIKMAEANERHANLLEKEINKTPEERANDHLFGVKITKPSNIS
jgi:hypothetical protein